MYLAHHELETVSLLIVIIIFISIITVNRFWPCILEAKYLTVLT